MSQPEPGACGDPGCYVLHADPSNPIHPPDYVAPGSAAASSDPWPRYLTPPEVAGLFRVDTKTVSRWAAMGRIPSRRTPGGHYRFLESDVRELLELEGG